MSLTLILFCEADLRSIEGLLDEFVMFIPEFPTVPSAGSTVHAPAQIEEDGSVFELPIDLKISDVAPAFRHRTNASAARTQVLLHAHTDSPLEWWTIPLIQKAFAQDGWKVLTLEEAEQQFPTFFNFGKGLA